MAAALAQERRYSSRSTVVGYLGSTEPQRAAEAAAFIAWRDAAFDYLFQKFAADEVGEAAPSTIEDFISGISADCLAGLQGEQLPMQGPAPVRRGAGPQPDAEQTGSKRRGLARFSRSSPQQSLGGGNIADNLRYVIPRSGYAK
ncbi:hypothetical protein [Neorhizobium tomejilense]|uniref:hypothetical protein n=1 Tax=Neorhizobium tomejilense TaxID=2093828 RepID=UPI003ECC774B